MQAGLSLPNGTPSFTKAGLWPSVHGSTRCTSHGGLAHTSCSVNINRINHRTSRSSFPPSAPGALGQEPLFSPHRLALERFLAVPISSQGSLFFPATSSNNLMNGTVVSSLPLRALGNTHWLLPLSSGSSSCPSSCLRPPTKTSWLWRRGPRCVPTWGSGRGCVVGLPGRRSEAWARPPTFSTGCWTAPARRGLTQDAQDHPGPRSNCPLLGAWASPVCSSPRRSGRSRRRLRASWGPLGI